MSANSNNEISVYTYENDSWALLGNKTTGEQGQAAMALAPDSTPYIITVNCLLKVYKYDGSNWTQVGGTVGNGYHMDINVANDGTPYVSYMDVTNNNFNIVDYPNPNSGQFTVLSNYNGKFQLLDIQGRVISEGILEIVDATSNNYTYTFNHSNLSKGLYLLSIANEQKR
ncbi:T9SS type A sorting domain-containing protein [Aequorivita sinensis]|uniref:T9SS type A sorting domain-containing protein n=1 Tax=Aequorivita sinensis TaxID=1382458 RepID=UPI0011205A37|nr:T9SS type A sorting domain-containing protein [Aequorivita sinensis]